jgi:hypothetical protein
MQSGKVDHKMPNPQNGPTRADDPADFPNDTNEQSTHKLILQGTDLVKEVRLLRKSVDKQRRSQFWTRIVGFLVALVLGVVAFSNHSEVSLLKRQMCGAVVGIVPAPGDAPPPPGREGERSREVIGRFRVLAQDFECTLRT